MGQSPSIPTDMSRDLRVIGAGFSRTGTVSFAMALEILLQGPVCHSGTAILMREEGTSSSLLYPSALSRNPKPENSTNTAPDYVRKWTAIQSSTASQDLIHTNLSSLTAGYIATTDTPAILFTEELCALYPKAIVICTTRERAAWWTSAQALFQNTGLWWLDIVFAPVPTLRLFGRWRDTVGERLEKVYGTSKANCDGPRTFSPSRFSLKFKPRPNEKQIELLDIHESYIRRVTPPERLFFYSVKDGWEPLCKILNCPVPNVPFPRANDGKAMQEFFEGMLKGALLRWLQIFVVLALFVVWGLWLWRS